MTSIDQGEQLERRRKRKVLAIKGSLFAIGMVSGAYLGFKLAREGFDLGAQWDPAISLALAIVYLVAVIGGSLLLRNSIDEHERFVTYKAVTVAGSAYLVVYPFWFLLWKAALAPEPIHWLLFIGFWLLLAGSALYYRFR